MADQCKKFRNISCQVTIDSSPSQKNLGIYSVVNYSKKLPKKHEQKTMDSSNSQENYVKVKKAGRLGNFRAMWKQVCGRWQISFWLISFLEGDSFIFGGRYQQKEGDQVLSSQQYGGVLSPLLTIIFWRLPKYCPAFRTPRATIASHISWAPTFDDKHGTIFFKAKESPRQSADHKEWCIGRK